MTLELNKNSGARSSYPSVALITGANEAYYSYLRGWLSSALRLRYPGKLTVVVLDAGLAPDTALMLAKFGVVVKSIHMPQALVGFCPSLMTAMVVRPELPRFCEGAEYILWSDADTWFQTDGALLEYVDAAQRSAVAVCVESDPQYDPVLWRQYEPKEVSPGNVVACWQDRITSWYGRHFGADWASLMSKYPMINTGMLCAKADSDIWEMWRKILHEAILAKGSNFYSGSDDLSDFLVEQSSFNFLARSCALDLGVLPPRLNWLCHLSPPAIDRSERLCLPSFPFDVLDVVHLSGTRAKHKKLRMRLLDINEPNGLRFDDRYAHSPYELPSPADVDQNWNSSE